MERLLSLFSLYDLLGFILPGGLFTAATYWAFEGLPHEPGGAITLGLIALFFIVGELVQGVAVVWEGPYWKRVTWPSERLMEEPSEGRSVLNDTIKTMINAHLAASYGDNIAKLSVQSKFALARAELRARGLDARSELLNARYSLARGLVTTTAALVIVFAVAAATTDTHRRNLIAFGVAIVALPFSFNRFRRFGEWFARQVWQDCAALSTASAAPKPTQ